MKIVSCFIFMLVINTSFAMQTLPFMWPKTNDCFSLNNAFLRTLCRLFKVDAFVESGTYLGKSCEAALACFDHIYSIELDATLYKQAAHHFANKPQVHIYHGSSDHVFLDLLPMLQDHKLLFWLDGHYSKTAELINASFIKSTPILDELESIRLCNVTNAIILVDDLRLFGAHPDYPTLEELKNAVKAISPDYQFIIYGDIGIAFNQSEPIMVSNALIGMTAYFFPDQFTVSWQLLLRQASQSERTAIKQLNGYFSIPDYRKWHQITK